jgi:hypothetical protein
MEGSAMKKTTRIFSSILCNHGAEVSNTGWAKCFKVTLPLPDYDPIWRFLNSFANLGGEPAMTLIPNLLVTGVLLPSCFH